VENQATMLEVVIHAGHQAHEYSLQHGGGKFEGKSRLAADGDSQQSAAVAVRHGGLRRGGDVKHYFDESFRQLTTATTIPISAVIGPVMDQVVVLLIWLPPSTPNPWSAQIRPNTARINPTVNVATKVLLI
jgi:hypothetical protein